jgi:glycosyltransferase involved in cell wall biosynthesis
MTNIEIIIVDDGSTDGTLNIANKFKNTDERITIVKQKKNKGVAAARNAGLAIASGNYVSFLDSDDSIEPIFCEELYGLATEHNADIVRCRRKKLVKTKKKKVEFGRIIGEKVKIAKPNGQAQMFIGNPIGLVTGCLFKRKMLQIHSLRFDEELRCLEGFVFCLKAYSFSTCSVHLPEHLYNYRIRQNSLTNDNPKLNAIIALAPALQILTDFFSDPTSYDNGYTGKLHAELIRFAHIHLADASLHNGNETMQYFKNAAKSAVELLNLPKFAKIRNDGIHERLTEAYNFIVNLANDEPAEAIQEEELNA